MQLQVLQRIANNNNESRGTKFIPISGKKTEFMIRKVGREETYLLAAKIAASSSLSLVFFFTSLMKVTSASLSSQSTSLLSNKSLHSWASPEDGDIDVLLAQLMHNSARINSQVETRTISRYGRSDQRWVVDDESKQVIRMVNEARKAHPALQDTYNYVNCKTFRPPLK